MHSGVLAGLCVAVMAVCVYLPEPCDAKAGDSSEDEEQDSNSAGSLAKGTDDANGHVSVDEELKAGNTSSEIQTRGLMGIFRAIKDTVVDFLSGGHDRYREVSVDHYPEPVKIIHDTNIHFPERVTFIHDLGSQYPEPDEFIPDPGSQDREPVNSYYDKNVQVYYDNHPEPNKYNRDHGNQYQEPVQSIHGHGRQYQEPAKFNRDHGSQHREPGKSIHNTNINVYVDNYPEPDKHNRDHGNQDPEPVKFNRDHGYQDPEPVNLNRDHGIPLTID